MKYYISVLASIVLLPTACGGDDSSGTLNPAWNTVSSPVTEDLHDASRSWAVGDKGTLLKSVDDGKTWSKQVLPTDADLYRFGDFSGAFNGVIAVGDKGTIIVSTDSGVTWTVKHTGSEKLRTIGGFFTPDNEFNLIAVGNDGSDIVRLVSTTKGESWTRSVIKPGATANDAAFSGDKGLVVGDDGLVIETADAGATWVPSTLPGVDKKPWRFVDGIDAMYGDGKLAQRINNNNVETWQAKSDATLPDMVSGIGKVAIGTDKASHQVLVTLTAANDFTLEDLGITTPLHAITNVDDGILVVGADGIILHRTGGN